MGTQTDEYENECQRRAKELEAISDQVVANIAPLKGFDPNFGGDVFGLLKGRIRRIRCIPFKGTYATYTYR